MSNVPVREVGRGRTVGVQTVALCTLLLPVNSALIIDMKVVGLSTDNLGGGATRSAAVKVIGGIITNLGDFQALSLKGDAGLAGVVVNVVANSGALELQVTGIAGKTIDWTGMLEGALHVTT